MPPSTEDGANVRSWDDVKRDVNRRVSGETEGSLVVCATLVPPCAADAQLSLGGSPIGSPGRALGCVVPASSGTGKIATKELSDSEEDFDFEEGDQVGVVSNSRGLNSTNSMGTQSDPLGSRDNIFMKKRVVQKQKNRNCIDAPAESISCLEGLEEEDPARRFSFERGSRKW